MRAPQRLSTPGHPAAAPFRHLPAGLAAAALAATLLAGPPAPAATAEASAPSCVPASENGSAALADGAVTVSPMPGSAAASHFTQISFLGVPAADIEAVVVEGSRSGRHPGSLEPYSQGDGASFVPATPFAEGERVSVSATVHVGATAVPIAWHFTTAEVDAVSRSLETPPRPPPPPKPSEFQHFRSRPELRPPAVAVSVDRGHAAPGDLFLAPYAGTGQYGPMILESDGALLWFKPLPSGARAADLRVQEYEGQPALTWWQDPLVAAGRRDAGVVIANRSYREVAIVRGGNGYQPDLHAFEITPQGTALLTVYDAIRCNLSAWGGPANGAIADTLVQEIDLGTGLVRFEWHSLDHVSPSYSYAPVHPNGTPTSPWDYFHVNAVSAHGNTLLINSRNTWAAYEVQRSGGQIAWTLGGKHSSLALGHGASPAWQHDARMLAPDLISFFDNGYTPQVHPQSRGIVLRLDFQHRTASLVASFVHPKPVLAGSQGDFQPLPDGHWMIGWGAEPYLSEFSSSGQLLFDARLPSSYYTYTTLKFQWSGEPSQPPQIAVVARPSRGAVVYASWNGATAVARWQVLEGNGTGKVRPVLSVPRHGFETAIALARVPRDVAVQALAAGGRVLGRSPVRRIGG